jgi:hypothetical protein
VFDGIIGENYSPILRRKKKKRKFQKKNVDEKGKNIVVNLYECMMREIELKNKSTLINVYGKSEYLMYRIEKCNSK